MDIMETGEKVICHIVGLTKCSKPSKPNKPIEFRAYTEDPSLCPVLCIKNYMVKRAEVIKDNASAFFITHGKPHHPASKDTLARWVKEVMQNSGIDTTVFKPHSTRGASNSKALQMGMPLEQVLKRGQWSNAYTFFQYYYREIDEWTD